MKRCFFLLLLATGRFGCSSLLYRMYGVRTIDKPDKTKCEKFISQINFKGISHGVAYADSFAFRCASELNSQRSGLRKSFSQPVQILYFRNDSLVSFHANCFAQGSLTNLNWNTAKRFDKFVPVSAIALDSITFNFRAYSKCYPGLYAEPNFTYTIVIIWSRILEKISKSATETVITNLCKFHQEMNVRICMINADEVFKNK